MIDVTARIVFQALVGEREQVGPLPEGNGFHRADLDTAGQFALLRDPFVAEGTFHHPGRDGVVVFIGRDLEGAGHHAVPAPDALAGVVVHRAVFLFRQGPHDAGRGTGRILAMHALDLDKGGNQLVAFVDFPGIVAVDDRITFFVRATLAVQDGQVIEGLLGLRQPIDRLAGLLAFAAPDAARQVHQASIGILRRARLPGPRRSACGGQPGTGGPHDFEKPSAAYIHMFPPVIERKRVAILPAPALPSTSSSSGKFRSW